MAFLLKKIVGLLVQPLSIILLLLLAGLILLWKRPDRRWGRYLTLAGTLLLLLASLQITPWLLGRALETRFEPYEAEATRPTPEFIVVLGGGTNDDATLPLSARLAPVALARVVEGVRIAGLHPEARLVLSGGYVFTTVSEAEVASDVVQMIGMDPARIITESQSRSTEDQAVAVRNIVRDRPFVLVTSAIHMPRSMALFRGQGMEPVPAPTAHTFGKGFNEGPQSFLPSARHVRALETVMHELYGIAWAWLRGLLR